MLMKKLIFKIALVYILITGTGFLLLQLPLVVAQRHPQWTEVVLIFLFCLTVFIIWLNNYIKQINKLNKMAQEFAKGNLSVTVSNFTDDELGKLNNAMQIMAYNLNEYLQKTLQEKDQMETILASMVEGVLAFDLTGRLMLINKTAEKMLDVVWEESRECYFLEILENYQIANLLNNCLVDGQIQMAEVRLSPEDLEYYRVYITPIKGKEGTSQGAVMVLRNVTKLRQLEQMRSEFIANVSHELRTPLTSIKGFVETLLDGALEDHEVANKFLTIINAEADRLSELINDLLFLSRLETGDMEIVKEEIDSRALLDKIINLLQPVAMNKNIKICSEVQTGAEVFQARQDMIEQVLINLLDNAIKYSYEEGLIRIIISSQQDNIVLQVIDQGIGIPAESLTRLFERFYRVDKARSRQVGGTGLGLSIVKHIVESHHGRVLVESQENRGTIFTVILPEG